MTIFKAIPEGLDTVETIALGTPALGAHVPIKIALLAEFFLTFLLVFAFFATAVDKRAPKIGGFAIGLTLAAGILVGGPISGASMNPARTFSPGLVANAWTAHWIYWVGPIADACLAGLIYHHVILKDAQET